MPSKHLAFGTCSVNFNYYIVIITIIILLLSLEGKGVVFISASLVAGPECQSESIELLIE